MYAALLLALWFACTALLTLAGGLLVVPVSGLTAAVARHSPAIREAANRAWCAGAETLNAACVGTFKTSPQTG